MKVKVYNQNVEEIDSVELPDSVFGIKWNADLVHQVVTSFADNMRRPIAHAKMRGEVSGGGKKPWRQKGTGRARHGSIRSPIWKGGGVTHGPRNEKVYARKINKKMARKALYVVLSAKARDNEIVVLDDLKFEAPQTKYAATLFTKFARKKEFSRMTKGNGVLVAVSDKGDMVRRTMRNLPYVRADEARNLNAHEVMQYKYIMFSRKTVEILK